MSLSYVKWIWESSRALINARVGQAGQICAAFAKRESVLETGSHKKYNTTIHHRIIIHTYYKMHYSLS